eukprot:UN32952
MIQVNVLYGTTRRVRDALHPNRTVTRNAAPGSTSIGIWQYLNEHNQWMTYPRNVITALNNQRTGTYTYTGTNGQRYAICLDTRTQSNVRYNTVRRIRCRGERGRRTTRG